MGLQIIGVRKPDRDDAHEAISHYRWHDDAEDTVGTDEREALIRWMKSTDTRAYVGVGKDKVWCGVRENKHGTKYLQTYADNKWTNNLLQLPPC